MMMMMMMMMMTLMWAKSWTKTSDDPPGSPLARARAAPHAATAARVRAPWAARGRWDGHEETGRKSHGGFDKSGYPHSWLLKKWKILWKWMIYRYPHFRKPPNMENGYIMLYNDQWMRPFTSRKVLIVYHMGISIHGCTPSSHPFWDWDFPW